MPTLIMTKGLPASGKTTWSKKQVANQNGKVKRINKDDLRAMIDNGKWSASNEKEILKVRDTLIRHYLGAGYDVIVDDTNLHPKHHQALAQMAEDFRAEFQIQDFTDTSLATCIKRDLERANSVSERVIRSMFNQFLKPKVAQYNPNPLCPAAVICDIDGTLAHGIGVTRKPYEWDKVGSDTVDFPVRDILQQYSLNRDPMEETHATTVVLLSGRDESCREQTEQWLKEHNVPYDYLYMRPEGDNRQDVVVKSELFDKYIRDRYNVLFVLDDRNAVVDMWRDMGLKCLQVAEGDF